MPAYMIFTRTGPVAARAELRRAAAKPSACATEAAALAQ